MNRWWLFFAGIGLGALCACAAQQEITTIPVVKKPPSVQVADLPCAEVDNTGSPTVRYPAENIYRNGAVLPTQEGLACLEELADWLKSVPQSRWQVTVSGEDGYGFDPLALAAKRQALLQRFFTRQGLGQKDWEWQAVIGQGVQLQLRAAP